MSARTASPVRVLFLGKDASRGGGMRMISYLLRHLDRSRFEPAVMLPAGGDLLEEYRRHAAAWVYEEESAFTGQGASSSLLFRHAETFTRRRWVLGKVREFRPDLMIHQYNRAIPLFDCLGDYRPISIQNCNRHGASLYRLGDNGQRRFLSRADRYLCQGRGIRDWLHACMGIPLDRLFTVCIGIDLALRDEQMRRPDRVRRRDAGIRDDELVVGAAGSLLYLKGVDLWVRAAALLKARYPDRRLKFLWIGGGERAFGAVYGRSIRALVEDLGLKSEVIFAGDQSAVYPWLDLCDIYIQPSRDDAFPHAILEAMALGKPCVSFPEGVAVEDYAQDALVRVDTVSPEGLASGIARLVESPGERERFGRAGLKLVQERFEVVATVREYEKVLLQIREKMRAPASGSQPDFP